MMKANCRTTMPRSPNRSAPSGCARPLPGRANCSAATASSSTTTSHASAVGEGVMSCPRAGCGKSACPDREEEEEDEEEEDEEEDEERNDEPPVVREPQ